MKVLLIDDIRTASVIEIIYGIEVTHTATSYQEGIAMLSQNEPFDLICLDHDLASYDDQGKELTGYDVMLFLEANPQFRPKDYLWVTANPVGRQNMQRCLDSFDKKQK